MDSLLSPSEERNRKIGRVISTIVHIILIALLFFNFFTYPDPPPGQEGVLVSFGEPELGMNDDPADAGGEVVEQPEPVEEKVEETPEEVVEEVPVVEEPKVEPKKEQPKPDNNKIKEDAASKERALRKKREEEKKQREAAEAKKKAEAEARKKRAEAEAKRKAEEARKKAEAEAKRKAEAEAKRRADAAKKASGLFGNNNNGSGSGSGGNEGNQGQVDGDPSGSALEGLGVGSVGGNLRGRGGTGPKFNPKAQVSGRVTVKVCVDDSGKVTSTRRTISNTTITNESVIRQAEAAAKKWTFKPGEEACGTVTYVIKLK
ncbi:MAG: cell envelope integrity protein TolA [Bacteroidota bacterium]